MHSVDTTRAGCICVFPSCRVGAAPAPTQGCRLRALFNSRAPEHTLADAACLATQSPLRTIQRVAGFLRRAFAGVGIESAGRYQSARSSSSSRTTFSCACSTFFTNAVMAGDMLRFRSFTTHQLLCIHGSQSMGTIRPCSISARTMPSAANMNASELVTICTARSSVGHSMAGKGLDSTLERACGRRRAARTGFRTRGGRVMTCANGYSSASTILGCALDVSRCPLRTMR